jgi:hypothetical protein
LPQFANDEGDPGMGLELGIDAFCSGTNGCDGDNRGAIHQLLSIILELRILVLLPVSTMPIILKLVNSN